MNLTVIFKGKEINESTSIVATVYLSQLVVNCFLLCGWDSHVLMLSVYHRPVVLSNGSEGGGSVGFLTIALLVGSKRPKGLWFHMILLAIPELDKRYYVYVFLSRT